MRAAYITGEYRVEVRDVPDPITPKGGVVVRVEACGICGSDLRAYRSGFRLDIIERIPGHEIAGTVADVDAEACTNLKVGDRVAFAADLSCWKCHYCRSGYPNLCHDHRVIGVHCTGGLAQYLAVDSGMLAGATINSMPEGLDYDLASMAEPLSSVIASQEDVPVHAGQWVAIFGAGPMGCLHTALSATRGARPILVEPSAERGLLAKQVVPVDHVVSGSGEESVQEVLGITNGAGADVSIVAAPVGEAIDQAISVTKKRGTVVAFGGLPRTRPKAFVDINKLHYNEIILRGSFSYGPRHHASALAAIAAGKPDVSEIVTHRLSLGRVAEAFELLDAGRALKIIILPHSG